MEAYTTSNGTKITGRVLETIKERIKADHDWQRIITDELRDVIPVHDEDLGEANEVYNFVEASIDEEELN
jgi:hypothetical protein